MGARWGQVQTPLDSQHSPPRLLQPSAPRGNDGGRKVTCQGTVTSQHLLKRNSSWLSPWGRMQHRQRASGEDGPGPHGSFPSQGPKWQVSSA